MAGGNEKPTDCEQEPEQKALERLREEAEYYRQALEVLEG